MLKFQSSDSVRMAHISSANICEYNKSDLTLKDRKWKCPDCKTKHDKYNILLL